MRYSSTNNPGRTCDLGTALCTGLAPDGGLFLPVSIPRLEPAFWHALGDLSLPDIGCALATPLIEELEPTELRSLIAEALDFPLPLRQLDEDVFLLELFHGPSLAFKDVGARFLARLLARLATEADAPLTLLVATSGDTGGAVAQAFHGVADMRVVVLFPRGKVSPLQERQFSSLGGNVLALAVEGSFDDCQSLVKSAFGDRGLGQRLASANSINIGRLLPQSFLFAQALAQWKRSSPPLFAVPSGNFGNLTAGLLAQAMGLPAAGFVAATNANDVVPRFLCTGRLEPRTTVATLSNAMDVGRPSNLERIQALFGARAEDLRPHFSARSFDDEQTVACIQKTHRESGVILDPHTAVGLLGLRAELRERGEGAGIVLATAHPAKFRGVLEPLIGAPIPLPARLARLAEQPSRAQPLRNHYAALVQVLTDLRH